METALTAVPKSAAEAASPAEKKLLNILKSENLVRTEAVEAAQLERSITEEDVGSILVRNGFLEQQNLISSLLKLDQSDLENEETVIPYIPAEVLLESRTMVMAETDDKAYISTLSNYRLVARIMTQYFPRKELCFLRADPEKIDQYLEKIDVYTNSESSTLEDTVRQAIEREASDIHIIPRGSSYSVMYRRLGVRGFAFEGEIDEYLTLSARIKDRARMDLAERRVPQDGGFNVEHNGRIVDLRVATVPTLDGEIIVIRILDPKNANKKLKDLGISQVDKWTKAISRSNGLVLVCGPTGSGKTTTLNSTVKHLDRFGKAIYTIEDPVEYNIPYIGQVNINHAVGLDFKRALRSFMRSDPDAILVGEIRDLETARIAINAAETGHLVLGTLHSSSIRGTIGRLRDLGVPPKELRYVLRGMLVQTLMRTTCTDCGGHDKTCQTCFGEVYGARTIVSECEYFPGLKEVDGLLETDDITWETIIQDGYNQYKEGKTDKEELLRLFGAEAQILIDADEELEKRKADGKLMLDS